MTAYEAEVRLIRWGESSSVGPWINLELPPLQNGAGHPFRGFPTGHQHGQRFRILFEAIDDNEEPLRDPGTSPESRRPDEASSPNVDVPRPPPTHPAGAREARKAAAKEFYASLDARGRAVADAGRLTEVVAFQRFAAERSGLPPDRDTANAFILAACGVGRKREIALSETAFDAWQQLKTEFDIATGRLAEPRR